MTKKLLQINTVINSGSTGRIAEEIGLLAMKNGWDSYIAFGRNDRESQSKKIKIGNDWDIKWHGLQTRLLDKHGLASTRATKKLITEIDAINPDIIHLHNIHGYYLNIQVLFNFLNKKKIPIVWTLHDCWTFTGHCAHFSFVGCDKWKSQCFACPEIKQYPSSIGFDNSRANYAIKKKLFTSCDNITLVPVSNWLDNLISASFLQKYSTKVIHNGVDLNVFKPSSSDEIEKIKKSFGLENKKIYLGVTSVWTDRKGLPDFIKLSALLKENEVIVLVGVTKKIIQILPKNVIGIERTENATQLAQIYAMSDIFINLTWEDSFPTTNIEALACGTPVITYDTGGSPEAISKETGLVIPQGDIDSVRTAMDILLKTTKKDFVDVCRKRAISLYDKDKNFHQYIDLYNSSC